ncbi:MAG: acylphosphatase [Deltaproteobacteria bacterium]|nr:acylphosphatase [Deltaproteobacteria bacterium]
MPSVRKRVVVTGRVQGVAFRASTHAQATRLGVAGWVKNRADGAVEAALEGDAAAVEALIAFCRRGPRFAEVRSVDVVDEPAEGLTEFAIR